MDLETIRRLTALERRLDNIVMPERSSDLISPFLSLPAIRGVWISTVDAAGVWKDCSGIDFDLTPAGNPKHNCPGLIPYWYYDGVGDYHSHVDHVNFDILGTEGYIESVARGLTMGGWFYPALTTSACMMGKADNANGPYFLWNSAGTQALFRIRDAADANNFNVYIPLTLNKWQFFVVRYKPSVETKIWNNAASNTNTTNIPASILNGTDTFGVGAFGLGANPFTGRAACCFLCAAAISDAQRSSMFEQTRGAFGV